MMKTTGMKAFAALAVLFVLVTSVAAPVIAQEQAQQAQLTIEQPRYVTEGVQQQTINGTSVYVARGEYLTIRPQNFNASSVTSFSVQEDAGTLTYDKPTNAYILNTQGNNGTYTARWRVGNNNSTTTYTARIRVVQASYVHIPSDQYETLKNQSARGSEIIGKFERAGDPDEPVADKVEFGLGAVEFAHNPLSALSGQFLALQIMRFTTPAGWLDLAIILSVVYLSTRGLYGALGRLRKQLEREEEVARREDVQYLKMYKSVLSGKLMSDVKGIDDYQAAILEEKLGKNLFTALHNFWNTWGADSLKRMYVQAMGAVGYRVVVTRNAEGEPVAYELIRPDDPAAYSDGGTPENSSVMNLADVSDDVISLLSWGDIDARVFDENPKISAVDCLMVANREREGDLIADLQISIPEDFQSREDFMDALGHFIHEVMETDFVDDEGRPRQDRAVLNHLLAFTSIMSDEYDVPLDLWWRAAIWNAEGLSRDDEASGVLADLKDSGSLGDSL